MQTLTTASLFQISGGINTSALIQTGLQAGAKSAAIAMSLELIAATHPQYGRGAAAIGTLYAISGALTDSCVDLWKLATSTSSTEK